MPIYEYACEHCSHRFEARQSFADEPLTSCPECQGHIRRVIHPSGIIFKGSGWYITDSRKSDSTTASDSKAGIAKSENGSTATEAKSETKSESKPAAADD